MAPRYGLNVALARRVRSADPGQLWIVPGSKGVCVFEILDDGAAGTCGTTQQALAGTIGITGTNAIGERAFGLAPRVHGHAAVAFARDADGRTQRLAAPDGVYYESSTAVANVAVRATNGATETLQTAITRP
jgi:hypothetical protein